MTDLIKKDSDGFWLEIYMFAKYRNKTVKILSKEKCCWYLISNNNPTQKEKETMFTLRDVLNNNKSIKEWKKECNVVSDLEDGMFYMWVDKHYLSFYSLIMETEWNFYLVFYIFYVLLCILEQPYILVNLYIVLQELAFLFVLFYIFLCIEVRRKKNWKIFSEHINVIFVNSEI